MTEFVELIDIGRADIGRQRGKDIADRDPQGFRLVSIDGHRDVRRVGTECGQDALQSADWPWRF